MRTPGKKLAVRGRMLEVTTSRFLGPLAVGATISTFVLLATWMGLPPAAQAGEILRIDSHFVRLPTETFTQDKKVQTAVIARLCGDTDACRVRLRASGVGEEVVGAVAEILLLTTSDGTKYHASSGSQHDIAQRGDITDAVGANILEVSAGYGECRFVDDQDRHLLIASPGLSNWATDCTLRIDD